MSTTEQKHAQQKVCALSQATTCISSVFTLKRHSGLMVSVPGFGLSGLGSSPDWGHFSHSASLHPGVKKMGIVKFTAGGNPAIGYHPIQAGVEILLAGHLIGCGKK